MKKLLFFWSELKATFWFIPVLIILLSILLAIGFVYADDVTTFSQDGLGRFLFVNSVDSARSILTTISGAMIGVAGTVFSVTLVALTLASSQLGPRLIKNFMYVRLNQVVLGSYISTYLYCLIVLNAIRETGGDTFIPVLSILIAIIAARLAEIKVLPSAVIVELTEMTGVLISLMKYFTLSYVGLIPNVRNEFLVPDEPDVLAISSI